MQLGAHTAGLQKRHIEGAARRRTPRRRRRVCGFPQRAARPTTAQPRRSASDFSTLGRRQEAQRVAAWSGSQPRLRTADWRAAAGHCPDQRGAGAPSSRRACWICPRKARQSSIPQVVVIPFSTAGRVALRWPRASEEEVELRVRHSGLCLDSADTLACSVRPRPARFLGVAATVPLARPVVVGGSIRPGLEVRTW